MTQLGMGDNPLLFCFLEDLSAKEMIMINDLIRIVKNKPDKQKCIFVGKTFSKFPKDTFTDSHITVTDDMSPELIKLVVEKSLYVIHAGDYLT
eukprot:UN22396